MVTVDRIRIKARKKYIERFHADYFKKNMCIIQPNHPSFGFFAHFINILGILRMEVEQGNEPYIDMSHFPNCYLKKEELGKVNTWDMYFEQPFTSEPIVIERERAIDKNWYIYQSNSQKGVAKILRNYFKCGDYLRPEDTMDFLTNPRAVAYWQAFTKRYITFNQPTKQHIEQLYQDLFKKDERVLGVLLRGTDFTDNRPKNHPIAPSVEEAIPQIREVFEAQEYDRIFLATEDSRIEARMQEEFQGKVFVAPQKRYGYTDQLLLNEIYATEELDAFAMGLDYISAISLLSKCQALMACRTSGAIAALLFAEDYEYTYFWNLGRYGTQEYEVQEVDR